MALSDWIQPASKITWPSALSSIGLLTLIWATLVFLRQATVYLLPCKLQQYNRAKDGHRSSWALVTGATDGIGFAFCQELCARGFNVILLGRNEAKLSKRAAELREQFPTSTVGSITLDAVPVDSAVNAVATMASDIMGSGRLSVLVNNVGGETRPYMTLGEYTFEEVQATVDKNAVFMAQLTRVLLPVLLRAERSLVLNVSSLSAFGLPYISIYSGTKGFVDSFTRALQAECAAEKNGVDVMGLKVGQVSTPGYPHGPNLFIPTARVMAKAGLDRVGSGKTIVWGYFWHWLQGLSFILLPRSILMKVTAQKMMALKKEEEAVAKTK
jgi:short-subunit dehydrogenase